MQASQQNSFTVKLITKASELKSSMLNSQTALRIMLALIWLDTKFTAILLKFYS